MTRIKTKQTSIYMDYAAASPLDPKILDKMLPYFTDNFYNPSATYLSAQAVAKDVAVARGNIAKCLGVKPVEIIFTAGGTEANNLAIRGVMQRYPGSELVISSIEHDSVIEPSKGYQTQQVEVKPDGRINLDDLEKSISEDTVLVSIILANNEIGTIQPISKIAKLIEGVRQARIQSGNKLPLYLHTDASQAPLYLDLHISRLGVDMLTLNGGKIYGPKQSGLLYVRAGIELEPIILGGGQERKLRSGTENVPAVIGLSEALCRAQAKHKAENNRITDLRDIFISELARVVPEATLNGSAKYRLCNNINITIPGRDNERLMMELDEVGIQCAVGSACSASSDEPSHVLKAIGLSETEAQSSLRFSLGKTTTEQQIRQVVSSLRTILDSSFA